MSKCVLGSALKSQHYIIIQFKHLGMSTPIIKTVPYPSCMYGIDEITYTGPGAFESLYLDKILVITC